jgi:hypothetical protein
MKLQDKLQAARKEIAYNAAMKVFMEEALKINTPPVQRWRELQMGKVGPIAWHPDLANSPIRRKL